jgi:hypothetical protein
MIGAMPPKPAPSGAIYAGIGGASVTPEVQSPYFDTFGAKPTGKPFVTAGVFRHAMHYL